MVFLLHGYQNFLLPPVKIRNFGPKTAKFGPKSAFLVILGQILPFFAHFVQCPTKNNFELIFVMWVIKHLISPVKKGFFAQKRPNLAQNWHFWSIWARPCRFIQCPVVGSVGGCGARAVSRKTPIYFMFFFLRYKKPASGCLEFSTPKGQVRVSHLNIE